MCIAFNLIIEKYSRFDSRKRTEIKMAWTDKPNGKDNAHFSILDGELKTNGNRYLTTYYTEIPSDGYTKKELVEGLGVENIQLNFDSYYTPTVTIKFIEVRGSANDLEVRLSEGSLAFPMMTDFKNFTHGRHAFVYEHQHEIAIVTFETKQDGRLAEEVINRYHAHEKMEKIPIIRIQSDKSTPLATIELLIKSMYFALDLAIALGLNLSKPNAPKLGVWEMDYLPFMDFD